ncbi:putative flippase GtrA [Marinisporobacter balticus]|uniref:Putative flippase GtrA n=2 Tax=Marinisporobacter balticus TaxID=2018667 RepID=A0A4R2KG10_9FIRM|nr:putative flippase GtrA [Marinisporobacter balticus]
MGLKYLKIFNYLILGFFTTVINISIYSILVLLKKSYMISNLVAFSISIIFAYITNKKWVFNHGDKKNIDVEELIKFCVARVGTLLMESIMLYIGITLLRFNQYGVKTIANIVVIIVNYVLSQYIVFKK